MAGQMMMGPQTPPQLDPEKQKIVDEKAKAVVEILKGMVVSEIGLVFNEANKIVMTETKV